MRLIFAGTPEFAAVALRQLCDAGFDVALVLTQPDRPAGRGLRLQASPVKALAQQRGIEVIQPRSLRTDGRFADDALAARTAIEAAQVDAMVVAAYGLILPQWVLDAMAGRPAALGCLNIHASLLPRWRGAAPIQRAIEAGDTHTGVCIMQMDAGLDTGDVLRSQAIEIRHDGPQADTAGRLQQRLAVLGAELILAVLQDAARAPLRATPQPGTGVTYAQKVHKADALIDWRRDAWQIACAVRAFDPAPGAWTTLGTEALKLWQAEPVAGAVLAAASAPGTVLASAAQGVEVACGSGSVRLLELQRAGGRRMACAEFLRGLALPVGCVLGQDAPAA